MSSEWRSGKLGEFIELKRGYDLPRAKRVKGIYPLVSSAGVSDCHDVPMVRGPGVVTGRYGTIGQVFFVRDDFWPLNTTLYVRDFKGNDPEFISYFLRTVDFFAYSDKAAVPGVNRNHLHEALTTMPALPVQKEIAAVLGALDDRIALLRETNATLEAIAQALFKSWFVDFDPVHAKLEGRAPEGMDDATAALFPDSFEESALGPVPKGWDKLPFTDTVDVIGGGTPKTSVEEYWNGDIPWFSVVDAPSLTDMFAMQTKKSITEAGLNNSSTKLLAEGATIISARGTVGRLALVGCMMAMNQSCYALRGKAGDAYFTYFSTYRLVESLKQRSHGSVFDTITTETMRGVYVIYPTKPVIDAFEQTLSALMNRVKTNLLQSRSLTELRDTLLPRLISGQLRLAEAETILEEVTA